MVDFASKFAAGSPYKAFLDRHGSPQDRRRWGEVEEQFRLTASQRDLLATFVREMNVLCLAGAWCGDCVGQGPILEHFARSCPKIHLRFTDRDADAELSAELRICGGGRVPVVVFLSEDFAECGRYGDRTLSRYRAMGEEQPGAACSTGIASPDALTQAADDWLREFERIQLMLRLSPRLRERHGD